MDRNEAVREGPTLGGRSFVPLVGEGPRPNVLRDALEAVRVRENRYGPPHEHFRRQVDALNAAGYQRNGHPLEPWEWAAAVMVDKLFGRSGNGGPPSWDSLVDIAGYAHTIGRLFND